MSDRCNSCNAEIVWAVTERGHAMPMDYPGENRLVIIGQRGGQDLVAVRMTYVSHFATCPHGAAWRHRRSSDGPRPEA